MMKLRAIGGTLLGVAAWPVVFMVMGIGFGLIWPDYRAAARVFFATQDFSQFTIPMMLTNFLLFAVTGAITGWLTSKIGGTRKAGLAVSAICFVYGGVSHFYREWGNLPDWYNLVVPWIMGGSIWLGARVSANPRTTPR